MSQFFVLSALVACVASVVGEHLTSYGPLSGHVLARASALLVQSDGGNVTDGGRYVLKVNASLPLGAMTQSIAWFRIVVPPFWPAGDVSNVLFTVDGVYLPDVEGPVSRYQNAIVALDPRLTRCVWPSHCYIVSLALTGVPAVFDDVVFGFSIDFGVGAIIPSGSCVPPFVIEAAGDIVRRRPHAVAVNASTGVPYVPKIETGSSGHGLEFGAAVVQPSTRGALPACPWMGAADSASTPTRGASVMIESVEKVKPSVQSDDIRTGLYVTMKLTDAAVVKGGSVFIWTGPRQSTWGSGAVVGEELNGLMLSGLSSGERVFAADAVDFGDGAFVTAEITPYTNAPWHGSLVTWQRSSPPTGVAVRNPVRLRVWVGGGPSVPDYLYVGSLKSSPANAAAAAAAGGGGGVFSRAQVIVLRDFTVSGSGVGGPAGGWGDRGERALGGDDEYGRYAVVRDVSAELYEDPATAGVVGGGVRLMKARVDATLPVIAVGMSGGTVAEGRGQSLRFGMGFGGTMSTFQAAVFAGGGEGFVADGSVVGGTWVTTVYASVSVVAPLTGWEQNNTLLAGAPYGWGGVPHPDTVNSEPGTFSIDAMMAGWPLPPPPSVSAPQYLPRVTHLQRGMRVGVEVDGLLGRYTGVWGREDCVLRKPWVQLEGRPAVEALLPRSELFSRNGLGGPGGGRCRTPTVHSFVAYPANDVTQSASSGEYVRIRVDVDLHIPLGGWAGVEDVTFDVLEVTVPGGFETLRGDVNASGMNVYAATPGVPIQRPPPGPPPPHTPRPPQRPSNHNIGWARPPYYWYDVRTATFTPSPSDSASETPTPTPTASPSPTVTATPEVTPTAPFTVRHVVFDDALSHPTATPHRLEHERIVGEGQLIGPFSSPRGSASVGAQRSVLRFAFPQVVEWQKAQKALFESGGGGVGANSPVFSSRVAIDVGPFRLSRACAPSSHRLGVVALRTTPAWYEDLDTSTRTATPTRTPSETETPPPYPPTATRTPFAGRSAAFKAVPLPALPPLVVVGGSLSLKSDASKYVRPLSAACVGQSSTALVACEACAGAQAADRVVRFVSPSIAENPVGRPPWRCVAVPRKAEFVEHFCTCSCPVTF